MHNATDSNESNWVFDKFLSGSEGDPSSKLITNDKPRCDVDQSYDKLIDEHFEERVGYLEMIPVHRQKVEFSLLLHFLQAQQVFAVQSALLKRFDLVNVFVLVEPEPLGFPRLHHRVAQELDHHEICQFHQVLLVAGFRAPFLVDVGQKHAGFSVFFQVGWVVPVLGLDQFVLG